MLDIHFISLHYIDLANNSVEVKPVEGDLNEYISLVIDKVLEDQSNRLFKYNDPTTQVISLVVSLIQNKHDDRFIQATDTIAARLLRIESDTQMRLRGITQLKWRFTLGFGSLSSSQFS